MATLPSFTSHTPARASDAQLIIDTLVNQFGITDTIQTNVGRLAVPAGLAAPTSPVVGQQWVMTNEGVGSARIYMRDGASKNVPYLPLRQVVKSAELPATINISSISLTDTGLTLNITTTGGRLRIKLVPSVTYLADNGQVFIAGSSTVSVTGELVAVVGSTQLGAACLADVGASAATLQAGAPPAAFEWDYQPAANTYTVKIQGRVGNASWVLGIHKGIALLVEEWGD